MAETKNSVTIKTATGATRFVTPLNEGVKANYTLGSEDYITLPFSTDKPIPFDLGDWCDLSEIYDASDGMRGTFAKVYKIVTLPSPTYNESTGGYDYQLRMDAYYFEWQKKLFLYMPKTGAREVAWSMTAALDKHLRCFEENLETYGFTYNGRNYTVSLDAKTIETAYTLSGGSVTTNAKLISYNETNLIDALTAMAEAWNCEWWVKGGTIYFGRLEDTSATRLTIENGVQCKNMTRNESKGTYATRLYVFGAERNIPPTYRKSLTFAVASVTTANDGRVKITDTARPLKASYFNESRLKYQEGSQISLVASTTGKHETVDKTATFAYKSAKKAIKSGIYKFRTANQRLELKLADGITEIEYKISLVMDGKSRPLIKGSTYVYTHVAAIKPNIQKEEDIAIGTEVKEAYLELSLTPKNVSGKSAEMYVVWVAGATLTEQNRFASIATAVTFQTGNSKGLGQITATVNPNYTESEQNTIYLPAGTSVKRNDKFTIAYLIEDKIPVSFWSVDMNTDTYVSGVVQRRLMLPEGTNYIDAYRYYNGKRAYIGETGYSAGNEMSHAEAVDAVIKTDEIYPRTQLTINKVKFYEKEQQQDGVGTGRFERFYYVSIYDSFPFAESYRIADKDLQICFYSGQLNGMVFNCNFHTSGSHFQDSNEALDANYYEIIANEDYGCKLPDTILHPQQGDKFALIGWDSTKMANLNLISNAEQELLRYGKDAVKRMMRDDGTYTCPMYSSFVAEDMKNRLLPIGYPVLLKNPSFFNEEGRKSRVIGYEINLDIPYDTPIFTCGESIEYSRIKSIEQKLNELTFNGETYYSSGNGSGVYLIGHGGNTPATDDNTFSARRILESFLRKDTSDHTDHKLTVGELEVLRDMVVRGNLNGDNATFQNLNILGKAVFANLEINKTTYTAGDVIQGCGSGTIDHIEYYNGFGDMAVPVKDGEKPNCARCFLKVDDGETAIQNTLQTGDLIRCQTFNIKKGVYQNVENTYWWRLCRFAGEDYVDIDIRDNAEACAVNSGYPAVGDVMVQMGNRDSDKQDRMNGIMYVVNGTHGDGIEGLAPAILQYSRLNTFKLTRRNILTCISPKESWFTGSMTISSGDGRTIPVRVFMGEWTEGTGAQYMQEWEYDGNMWLCIYVEEDEAGNYLVTNERPSFDSPHWQWIGGRGRETYRMEIDLGGDSLLGANETKTIVCRVMRGWEDVTKDFPWWKVVRSTGSQTEDGTWNNSHKDFKGTLSITPKDLGLLTDKTTFTFTASTEQQDATVKATLNIE